MDLDPKAGHCTDSWEGFPDWETKTKQTYSEHADSLSDSVYTVGMPTHSVTVYIQWACRLTQWQCIYSGHADSPSDSVRGGSRGNGFRKPGPCSVPHFVLDGEVSHWAVVICARLPGDGDVPRVDLQTSHCRLSWLFRPIWRNKRHRC